MFFNVQIICFHGKIGVASIFYWGGSCHPLDQPLFLVDLNILNISTAYCNPFPLDLVVLLQKESPTLTGTACYLQPFTVVPAIQRSNA